MGRNDPLTMGSFTPQFKHHFLVAVTASRIIKGMDYWTGLLEAFKNV